MLSQNSAVRRYQTKVTKHGETRVIHLIHLQMSLYFSQGYCWLLLVIAGFAMFSHFSLVSSHSRIFETTLLVIIYLSALDTDLVNHQLVDKDIWPTKPTLLIPLPKILLWNCRPTKVCLKLAIKTDTGRLSHMWYHTF